MFINLFKFSCSRAWNHWQWKHIMRDGFICMLFLMRTKRWSFITSCKSNSKIHCIFFNDWLMKQAHDFPRLFILSRVNLFSFLNLHKICIVFICPLTLYMEQIQWGLLVLEWVHDFVFFFSFHFSKRFSNIYENSFFDKICIIKWMHLISHQSKKIPCFCVC